MTGGGGIPLVRDACWIAATVLIPLLLTSLVHAFDIAPDEWPMIRRDPRNLATSPLRGRMTAAPVVRSTVCLGSSPAGEGAGVNGYMTADLDGDGREEILLTAGGPVRAIRGDGRELWRTLIPRGRPNLIGIADLDVCGTPEVVCATGQPATAHILSGRNGRVLWERSFDEQVDFTTGTRIGDLDGDGSPELFLLGNAPARNSRKLGWAFSFAVGFAKPRLLWGGNPLPFNPHFRPHTIIADVDGDSKPEVVVSSALHSGGVGLMVVVFGGATGAVERQANFPNGDRCYGHLQAVRIAGKPQRDILVVGMLGRQHITYLVNDDAGMREAWHVNGTFEIPFNPVADVDGDGRQEIIYNSLRGDLSPSRSEDVVLTVRDLTTGQVKREVSGLRVRGIADLDSHPSIIATTVPEGRILLHVATKRQRELPVAGARLCLVAPHPPLHMMNEVLPDRSGYDVFTRDVDGDGQPELFVATPDRVMAVDLVSDRPKTQFRFSKHKPWTLLGTVAVAPRRREALFFASDDGLGIVSMKGRRIAQATIHSLAPRVAIAARLKPGAGMTVFASPANRDLTAYDGKSLVLGEPRVLWTVENLGAFEAATVCDVDGDGQKETLACDASSAEITVLSQEGRILRRLLPLPTDRTSFVTGCCVVARGPTGAAVGAVSAVGPNDGIAKWTMYDYATGRVLWWREGGPHPRRTPAVWDVNGDGVDDLVYSHYFDFCEANGKTGEFLHYVAGVVPGYHVAAVADLDGSGQASVLLSGGYAGIYRFGLDARGVWRTPPLDYNAGSAGAVADVDGDGKPEVGVAFTDRFVCYDAATGEPKWAVALPGRGSDVIAADINGDGRADFLFGCTDGKLYAVASSAEGDCGRVLWTVDLGAPVGMPTVADLDDDGHAEILVCTQNGELHVLASRK